MRPELLVALLDPTLEMRLEKQRVIAQLQRVVEDKAARSPLPPWWQWSIWLALGITVRRIEAA